MSDFEFQLPVWYSCEGKERCLGFKPHFNSLPNDKDLDWFKLKVCADNKVNVT